MKKSSRLIISLVLSVVMVFGMIACVDSNEDPEPPIIVNPPKPVNEVKSITILYDGMKVTGGVLSVDLTEETILLSADVRKTGTVDSTVSFSSSEPSVAEIDASSGKVVIKKKGETIITANAGDKNHSIALIIGDEFGSAKAKYTITVIGGTSNVTSSEAGVQVTLTAAVNEYERDHLSFVEWEYLDADSLDKIDNLWINGNNFRMPSRNILVRAICEDKLYTLNVVNGTVHTAFSDSEPLELTGTENGDVMKYDLPFNTEVTLKANQAKPETMFVGWDYEMTLNRVGELGVEEYSFTMPSETLTVFGVFSEVKPLVFGSVSAGSSRSVITDGYVEGEVAPDPDLEGMNGYRLEFSGNTAANEVGYKLENFTNNQGFSTLRFGSQTVKTIFKNNHDTLPISVELYTTMYSTVNGTGVVTIEPGETKTVLFVASVGFHNPSFGFALRESLTGASTDKVLLDVVFQTADTYPSGDPQFRVVDGEYVKLVSRHPSAPDFPAGTGIRNDAYLPGPGLADTYQNATKATGIPFGGRRNVNNDYGITSIITRSAYFDFTKGGLPYISAKLANLPTFDPANPEITIYFRVINTNQNEGTFKFNIGTVENPHLDSNKVSYDLVIEGNSSRLFGITIPRAEADEVFFSIIKPINDSTGAATNGGNYDHNIIIQMLFNNKIGVEESEIIAKP